MKKALATTWLLLFCAEAHAAPLFLYPENDLSFGETAIYTPGLPGYVNLDPNSGAVTVQNAAVLTAPTLGTFIIEGNDGKNITVTVVPGALTCDPTYINPCVSSPTMTVSHNFTGQISGNYCPKRPKCQDTVSVGGRLAFAGIELGRWTSTVTITANYQ